MSPAGTGRTEMYVYVKVFPVGIWNAGGRLARLGRIMLCI